MFVLGLYSTAVVLLWTSYSDAKIECNHAIDAFIVFQGPHPKYRGE